MLRNVIRYGGIALVIIGIILVMKNLFNSDASFDNQKNKKNVVNSNSYYSVNVSLLDQDSHSFLIGGNLVIKDAEGNVISGWTTEEGVHLVPNLKKGFYTLIEEEAPNGYHLNSDGIKFEIKNKDQEIVMYNTKMSEEEKIAYEAEQRAVNTVSSEVDVDNTLSSKNFVTIFVAFVCFVFGIGMIFSKREF